MSNELKEIHPLWLASGSIRHTADYLVDAMQRTQSHGTHGELKALHDKVIEIEKEIKTQLDHLRRVEKENQ